MHKSHRYGAIRSQTCSNHNHVDTVPTDLHAVFKDLLRCRCPIDALGAADALDVEVSISRVLEDAHIVMITFSVALRWQNLRTNVETTCAVHVCIGVNIERRNLAVAIKVAFVPVRDIGWRAWH